MRRHTISSVQPLHLCRIWFLSWRCHPANDHGGKRALPLHWNHHLWSQRHLKNITGIIYNHLESIYLLESSNLMTYPLSLNKGIKKNNGLLPLKRNAKTVCHWSDQEDTRAMNHNSWRHIWHRPFFWTSHEQILSCTWRVSQIMMAPGVLGCGAGLEGISWILGILNEMPAKITKGHCSIIHKMVSYASALHNINVGTTFLLTKETWLSLFALNYLLLNWSHVNIIPVY